jgi:hypothetical protein
MGALRANVPFGKHLTSQNIDYTRHNPHLNSRPLIFQHIPKTAGASMAQVIDSFFDDSEICPAANPPDFELISPDEPYQLYRGHVVAEQFRVFPAEAELFTILRDPIGYAFSLYEWLRGVEEDLWNDTPSATTESDGVAAEHEGMKQSSMTASDLVKDHSLAEMLEMTRPIAELMFKNPYLRWLTRRRSPEGGKARVAYLNDIMVDGENHFKSAMAHLAGALCLGDFARLEAATLVLCHRRGWPAPPRLPSIHRMNTRRTDPSALAKIEEVIRRASPYEFPLYDFLQARAARDEEMLVAEAGGIDRVRDYLDARYRDRFFALGQPTFGFRVTGRMAWAGCGWGVKERHAGDRPLRTFDDGRSATLLARLETVTPYILVLEVYKAATFEDIEGLSVSVGNTTLERVALNRSERGLISAVFDVPQAEIAKTNGKVEFRIAAHESTPQASIFFSSIHCQPRHY